MTLRTLTPLFSGGINRKCENDLTPTSYLGTLRWYSEAFLRGKGYRACNEHNCTADTLCAACSLFGSTNYRSRFSLEMKGAWSKSSSAKITRPPAADGPKPQSYLLPEGLLTKPEGLNIRFSLIFPQGTLHAPWDTTDPISFLNAISANITSRAAWGAKSSYGYGWMSIDSPEVAPENLETTFPPNHPTFPGEPRWSQLFCVDLELPKLTWPAGWAFEGSPENGFLAENIMAIGPILSTMTRSYLHGIEDITDNERHLLKGDVKSPQTRSCIAWTHAVRANDDSPWQVRCHGWFPDSMTKHRSEWVNTTPSDNRALRIVRSLCPSALIKNRLVWQGELP